MEKEEETGEELSKDEIFAIMWSMYQPEGGHFNRWHGAQLSWLSGGLILDDYSDHSALIKMILEEAPQTWHDTFAHSFTEGVEL